MKKVTRLAFIFAGALGALLAIAFLAVNLYVQSKGTQARIEQELSERLGATLQIRRISVTPWWGLKLTGITMPQADEAVPEDFLRADAFRLRIRIASLFSRRLVIKEIALINPTVVWAQNADGKWRLPMSFRPAAAEAAPDAPAPSVVPDLAPTPPAAPPVRSESVAVEAPKFTPEVRRVALTNGMFRFLNEKKEPVATFEAVRFRSNFRSATALTGNASIEKISLRDRFFLTALKSPLTYDPDELDFSAITAQAAGGDILGRFTMRPGDLESPFSVTVRFRNLDADRIVSDAHGPMGMVHGKLEGHLDATGKTADANMLNGVGEIHLRNGQVRGYSLLVALGQLLQVDELMQLRLDEAHVKYHIAPGVVTIDELLLASPNIRLSAHGTVSFGGELRLESQLALNERIRRRLFSAVRDNFKPTDAPGYAAVAFQVSGTVEDPKTDLMDKVVGPELRDLGGVINSLLGRSRGERAKRKKTREDAAAQAVPSESPSPAESDAASATPDQSPAPDRSP